MNVLHISDLFMDRNRRPVTYRIDELVIQAIEELALENNSSVTRYIENLLFSHAKEKGKISSNTNPIGEKRGGDQRSKKNIDKE